MIGEKLKVFRKELFFRLFFNLVPYFVRITDKSPPFPSKEVQPEPENQGPENQGPGTRDQRTRDLKRST